MFRLKQIAQVWMLLATLSLFMGAGDDNARFSALGHRVMCVCGCNYVLLECNHVGCPNSERMRDELATAVKANNDDNSVFQIFIKKYGPAVMLAPPKNGFGRVAWITPYIVLIFGLGLVFVIVRIWNKRRSKVAPAGGLAVEHPEVFDSFRDQVRRDTGI
jgi:cytochrome c-type biogenesis protein CcmH